MSDQSLPPEPHDRRDLRRVGPVIFSCGFVPLLIGLRFWLSGDGVDANAAFMFWAVAAMLMIVGAIIAFRAWASPVTPPNPDRTAP